MRLVRAELFPFAWPLVAPLVTAHGKIEARTGWLLELEDDLGHRGFGEAAPLRHFGTEDESTCHRALEAAVEAIRRDAGATGLLDLARSFAAVCACSAIEGALADLRGRRANRRLAEEIRARAGLAGQPLDVVRTQALVAGIDPEDVAADARCARERGHSAFKLKVGLRRDDWAPDVDRLAALREAVGGEATIRLDANEAWRVDDARRAIASFARYGVDFIEQPVARADLEGLSALARDGAIEVAADEALQDGGARDCLVGRVAQVFVVKPAALGGLGASLELYRGATEAGIRVIWSTLIDGAVGRAVPLALASALGRPDEIHGLGTASLLAADHGSETAHGIAERADELPVRDGPGIGFVPVGAHVLLGDDQGPRDMGTGWARVLEAAPPDSLALDVETGAVSYGVLSRAVEAMASRMDELGLRAGDLVAVSARPSFEGVVLLHALLDRGIVALPLNARLRDPEKRAAILESKARAVVFDEGVRALAFELAQAGVGVLRLGRGGETSVALDWETLSARRRDAELMTARAKRRSQDAALVLRTSGTSGRPKGAVLGLGQLRASATGSAALLGSKASDRWLLCMPLFHIGGLSIPIRAALAQASVVIHERFDAEAVSRALEQQGVTRVSLVATMLERVLEVRAGRAAPASLELVLLGGGPASGDLLKRAEALGYPIAMTYGLTEAASQVATRPPEPDRGAPGDDLSGGLVPLGGVEVRVVDDEGDEPAADENGSREGEIWVRGPIVMQGYLDDPEASAAVLRDGWLATGDFGRMDRAGRLRVLDRRSDLIISGGENVYPAEIESLLEGCEIVLEAGVFGVSDREFGARPVAAVVLRAGACWEVEGAEIRRVCETRLASYKQPARFWVVDALPRTSTGKLMRRRLKENWRAENPID